MHQQISGRCRKTRTRKCVGPQCGSLQHSEDLQVWHVSLLLSLSSIILKTSLPRSNTAGSPTVTQMSLLRTSVSFSRNLSYKCVYQINTPIIHLSYPLCILCDHHEVDGRWVDKAPGAEAPLLAGSCPSSLSLPVTILSSSEHSADSLFRQH